MKGRLYPKGKQGRVARAHGPGMVLGPGTGRTVIAGSTAWQGHRRRHRRLAVQPKETRVAVSRSNYSRCFPFSLLLRKKRKPS